MQELSPTLLAATRFAYGKQGALPPSLSREKTQYTYRLLILEEGELTAILGERRHTMAAGDLLYLPPAVCYRLEATAPFTLLQVSFDLLGDTHAAGHPLCVFTADLRPSLCASLPTGEVYAPLRMGGVFRDPAAGRAFSDLLALGAAAPLYGFFSKAALMATLSGILRRSAPRPHRGEEILAYIRSHPEQRLDAAALAARFSYHKNYVNALVREASGVSLSRYVRRVRMTHACGLMREGGLTPAEVAAELGYYDYSHFYKAFVAELGVSPTAYLKG